MRLRVLEEWNKFSQAVLPKDCSALQRKEMRVAFYGGATAMFHGLLLRLDPGNDATDGDLETMSAIGKELDEFAKTVAEGRA